LGGDFESNYAYYALHKLKILPSQFVNLERAEKAFVIACIDIKIENDRKQSQRAKKSIKRR